MAQKISFKDTDMQVVIGWVLRIGVIVSISIVFFGGIIFLYRHGQEVVDHRKFVGIPDFIQNFKGIMYGIVTFRGQAIIQFGIILLIATPILRVIFSTIGFVLEKDKLYIFISLLVLLIIFASMLSGHAG
ncbi:Uncharacterized membrane protein [Mucilaginibacter mallensis]|uniref:Uncharacterized membrane protein n=1 Tax=Mucilaginibacter mallensis TaxID=652787 RepID=A0A1H1PCL5_MUCMA|nr:DUF1634 domain-containing protein [Mucilaginibacter mallensis]SDS09016.1 Uncharacterized membrane protein [Mucilaginibacter mallensis]